MMLLYRAMICAISTSHLFRRLCSFSILSVIVGFPAPEKNFGMSCAAPAATTFLLYAIFVFLPTFNVF